MSFTRCIHVALAWFLVQGLPALAQEPILPHGDPRLQSSDEERARRDEIRDQRLKQQGQGSNYRIEGERQGSPEHMPPSSGDPSGPARQDTGISDPSVNPGQATGMKTIQGRVVESKADRLVVHQLNGKDTTFLIDGETRGDTDLHPGDVVTGVITPQGRAVAIQREQSSSKK